MAAPIERLQLMRDGEVFFLAQLDTLSDDDLFARSALPGWTRAHVVSHFARNAAALINLLDWARTGVATPMYPSVEARSDGIEAGARQSAAALRAEAVTGSERLQAALAAMPEDAWDGEIRTALGRQTNGAEVPWMRIRENWVHAVDLAAGATVDQFPPQVVADLLDEVIGTVGGRDDCPAAVLEATDTARTWTIGREAKVAILSGTEAALLAWLIGRSGGEGVVSSGGTVPTAPRWL
jgi:maleylpyruvate isomerase